MLQLQIDVSGVGGAKESRQDYWGYKEGKDVWVVM